jgi:hypothetical protein
MSSIQEFKISICILVTMQVGVLRNPIVTDFKLTGLFGHLLAV